MFVARAAAAASLLAGLALGKAFATIDPCPDAPKSLTQLHQSVTVTAQHQPVTTCARSDTGFAWNTYNWVSTVIPCWGGSSSSSCTVTDTAQVVPCTGTATTITSTVPTSIAKPNGTYETWNSTNYVTVSKLWVAQYNELGPLAIPGFGGGELCRECGAQGDGSRKQNLNVTECTSVAGKAPVCSRFVDTWTSKSGPSAAGPATATISTYTAVPSGGVYTFYFPQPAPSTTTKSQQQIYTIPAKPWTAAVTKSFSGPTSFDIIVTVTKTLTFSVPYHSDSNPGKTSAPEGFPRHGWEPWQQGQGAKSTPTFSTITTAYTTSTATSEDNPAETSSFYIEVTYSGLRRRYKKRGDTIFIGFLDGSDDASVVNENPSKFFFDQEGNLRVGGQYVSADSSSGYFVFERSDSKPTTARSYSLSADGTFSPPDGGAFCATPSNFFVTFGSSPSNCKPLTCKARGDENSSNATSNSDWTTATTETTTSTTTTADVSGDYDVPDPTPYVRRSARYWRP